MIKNFFNSIKFQQFKLKAYNYLIYYIIVQNIITITILPIYCSWGLGLSILSLIANIFFLPFLSIFILLSLLIFIGLVFKIALFPLIFLLNNFVDFWFSLIAWMCSKSYCIYFINSYYSFFICWGSSFFLIFIKYSRETKERWIMFSTILFLICTCSLYLIKPITNIFILNKYEKPVLIINSKNGAMIFDYSILRPSKKTFNSFWMNFKIKMELAKHFGHVNIKNYLFCK